MQYFAPLLLLALSPLTILAQPPHRAQTALAESSRVVHALEEACDEYESAMALSKKVPPDCLRPSYECVEHVEELAIRIGEANMQLFFAAKYFVPKVPCATIDGVFGRLRTHIDEFNVALRRLATDSGVTYAFKGKADDFHRVFLDQVEEVDKLGSIFANNKACNNPQSPAQLREFTKKVEAVKAEDIKLAQVFKDLIKENHLPRESGDNLEVTVSIHGADSDGEL